MNNTYAIGGLAQSVELIIYRTVSESAKIAEAYSDKYFSNEPFINGVVCSLMEDIAIKIRKAPEIIKILPSVREHLGFVENIIETARDYICVEGVNVRSLDGKSSIKLPTYQEGGPLLLSLKAYDLSDLKFKTLLSGKK